MNRPQQLALRADGTLFVRRYDDTLVRIEPTGFGQPVLEPSGAQSVLSGPGWCNQAGSAFSGAFAPLVDDSLLFTCSTQAMVRSPQGVITRVAGPASNGVSGYAGDGGPAIRGLFQQMSPIAFGTKNDIFVAEGTTGRIRRLHAPSPTQGVGVFNVPSADGSEIYEFSPAGRHLRTRTALRGTPRFTFAYDAPTNGRVASITDEAANITQVVRGASSVSITSPYGQLTTLNLDVNGYLSSVTNPGGLETTQLSHSSTGLLTDLVDPNGHAHHFEYAVDGRLTRDVDATPGSLGTRLVTTSNATSYTVEITSPEGRVTRHEVNRNQNFGDSAIMERRRITNGAGLTTVSDKSVDGSLAVTRPNGSATTVLETAADPRWGLASYSKTVRTQVGSHSMTRAESRTATLDSPGDPFSVSSQTIATTLSGVGLTDAVTTRVFAAGPPATWITTSPAGRLSRETLDSLERVTETGLLGSTPIVLNPVQYHYDTHGRVDQIMQGTRVFSTAYNGTSGWPDSTSAPEGLGITYGTRDAMGRPTLVTLPGSRDLAMAYDLAGNATSVTPPSKPAHGFGFSEQNQLASYLPPDVIPAINPKDTGYVYDKDGLLLAAQQPGTPFTQNYDALGRIKQIADGVTKTFTYDASGQLQVASTSDTVTLTNTYDGSLLTQQAITGPFSRTLSKSYDNFLRVAGWNIDGGAFPAVVVGYDADGYVTGAGGMSVTRGTNGLLSALSLGSVSDAFTYNAYGEVTAHSVTGSTQAYSVTYDRDTAGRVHIKTETIGGVTKAYRYEYDSSGRLWQVFVDAVPTGNYTYDANGNRDPAVAAYDAQDRMTASGTAT